MNKHTITFLFINEVHHFILDRLHFVARALDPTTFG